MKYGGSMKKLFVTILIMSASIINAEPWNKSVDANLTLTQNAYSNNWAGSEVGVISWAFNSNSLLEKQLSSKMNNKNTLKLLFGQTMNQVQETDTSEKNGEPQSNFLTS